jgi:hypothetical protein
MRLSAALDGVITTGVPEAVNQGIELQSAWERICSQQALDHTDNLLYSKRSKGNVVLVYVDSSHWAAELSMSKEFYRQRLADLLHTQIDDIVFEISRSAALKREFRKREPAGQDKAGLVEPIPLTSEEDGHTREMLNGIADKQLREKLYEAIKADLEWKKGIEGIKSPQAAPESPETI